MDREHADTKRSSWAAALAGAPEWVMHRVKRELSRRRLPEQLKQKHRQLDRMEGLCPPPRANNLERYQRLLNAMADDA
jgi:hypothetical protein